MISRQAVLEVALCFAGRELTDGEENVLSILCGGALDAVAGAPTGGCDGRGLPGPIGGGQCLDGAGQE